jgi:hypothetical protein
MGLSSDIPFYKLALVVAGFAIHDSYYWTLRKVSKARDYLTDCLEDTATSFNHISNHILYESGLSSDSQVPRTFPQFRQLPPEIRRQIWQCSIQIPRVIEIRNPGPGTTKKLQDPGMMSTCRIPPVLHACQESRAEALTRYKLSFGTELSDGTPVLPSRVYVDFSQDIIYFGSNSNFYVIQDAQVFEGRKSSFKDLEKIRFLALRSRGFPHVSEATFKLQLFRQLKEIVLVTERRFDLGPEPCLNIEMETNLFQVLPRLDFHMRNLQNRVQEWKGRFPDWEQPMLRRGMFIKGPKDRWYSE